MIQTLAYGGKWGSNVIFFKCISSCSKSIYWIIPFSTDIKSFMSNFSIHRNVCVRVYTYVCVVLWCAHTHTHGCFRLCSLLACGTPWSLVKRNHSLVPLRQKPWRPQQLHTSWSWWPSPGSRPPPPSGWCCWRWASPGSTSAQLQSQRNWKSRYTRAPEVTRVENQNDKSP